MKIINAEEKIILYLYKNFFSTNNKEIITKEIKDLFIKLIKYYKLSFSGIYDVYVYENKLYGTIIEIIKKDNLLFSPDLIDIKVKIKKDTNIYLKTKDYFVFKDYKSVYYYNNFYYIPIDIIDNDYLKLIELTEIEYNLDLKLLQKVCLKNSYKEKGMNFI